MKNLFNQEVASNISKAIKKNWTDFNHSSFIKNIDKELAPLELKDRVAFITNRLKSHLPHDSRVAIPILVKALKDEKKNPDGLASFSVWPLTHYVALYGIDHFDLSLNALREMTKVFTSEFAIRPFFIKDQKKTLKFMRECTRDQNEHVRRWASEGSRPLLPWGEKLHCFVANPLDTWDILEKLKNDPSMYVRKSVANHINDHSKNHPELVIEKLLCWYHDKNKTAEIDWIIKHASRSLIKNGVKAAFVLHGIEESKIKILDQKIIKNKIKLGDSLLVEFTIKNLSNKSAQMIIDHELHLLKANSKHLIKVFKGKRITLAAGQIKTLEMSIPLKPVTTRVYYSGEHYWNAKINGVSGERIQFQLKVK